MWCTQLRTMMRAIMLAALLCSIITVAHATNGPGAPLPQPPVRSSVNGSLTTTLHVVVSRISQGPFAFTRRSYEGLPVGPTLRVRRGDTLTIVLDNQLGTEPETAIGQHYTNAMAKNRTGSWWHDRDVYAYPNHTNLHLHGLHVSPNGDADNIFRDAAPQTSLTYRYHIPADHPSGTFWYHPHFHGSSSLQLASGMMGALIVEDDEDDGDGDSDGALAAMEEIVLVLHEVSHSRMPFRAKNIICYFCLDNFIWPSGDRLPLDKKLDAATYPEFKKCGGKRFPNTTKDFMQMTQPLDCTYALVNGVYQPSIAAVAGAMQRWRLVQSNHQSTVRLAIDGACEALVLARDGIYLPAPRNVTGAALTVAAGSRVDFGVRCRAPGTYTVSSLPGGVHNSSAIKGAKVLYEPVLYPRTLATIVVAPAPAASPRARAAAAPLRLPPPFPGRGDAGDVDLLAAPVDRRYRVVYNLTGYGVQKGASPGFIGLMENGGEFSINGKSYTNRTEHCMVLGLVEEWTVVNAANKLDRWLHSFHVHQNSFQIVSQDTGEADQPAVEDLRPGDWRDTVMVPVHGSVTFRVRATNFTGKFPFHCHVTAHQGLGMMQLVEVFADASACPSADD